MNTHILTFDIEHWYDGWRRKNLDGWQGLPDCDTPIVDALLDLLDESGRSATFFFTGRFAREFPSLARKCVERGHEVASHSDQHMLLTSFSDISAMKEDIARSLDIIAQSTGCFPKGFRAPTWSVMPGMEAGVFELLSELGLLYDSSFFPKPRSERARCHVPHTIILPSGRSIHEIPVTALRLGLVSLPYGGAYFRLFPLLAGRLMFSQCAKRGVPGLMYAHPFDLNPDTHFVPGGGLFFRSRRLVGVRGAWKKLTLLLKTLEFTRIDHWLDSHCGKLPEVQV